MCTIVGGGNVVGARARAGARAHAHLCARAGAVRASPGPDTVYGAQNQPHTQCGGCSIIVLVWAQILLLLYLRRLRKMAFAIKLSYFHFWPSAAF